MAVIIAERIDEMPRDDWLTLRRGGIGGSDAAACAGVSKYTTPYTLWLDKTGRPFEDNAGEPAYWGTRLEDIIREEIGLRETELTDVMAPYTMYRHDKYEWMFANPDGFAMHPTKGLVLIECKTAGGWTKDGWNDDGTPDAYMLQIQHYMAVLGLQWCIIGCLIEGQRFVSRWVERDDELIADLIDIERSFWEDYVLTDTEPPLLAIAAETKAIRYQFREDTTPAVIFEDGEIEKVQEIRDLQAQARELKKEIDGMKDELRVRLGSAEAGRAADGTELVTWHKHTNQKFDEAAFSATHPDLYAKFHKEVSSRTFLIKKPKSPK